MSLQSWVRFQVTSGECIQVQHAKLIASHMSLGVPFLDMMQLFKTAAEDLRREEMFGVFDSAWL